MKTLAVLIVSLFMLIVSPIWRGYALSKLWSWFIASTFGLIQLGIPQSIGIALIVSFLTYQQHDCQKGDKSDDDKIIGGVFLAFLTPAVALLFGWVIKSFL